MQIDSGIVAVFVSTLIALLGLAGSVGALYEKVKQNRNDIINDRKCNREDHQMMFDKLDEIKDRIARNGKG